MVLRGRNTLSTLRDLMVLMSFPLLLPLHTGHTHKYAKKKDTRRNTQGQRAQANASSSVLLIPQWQWAAIP